jgi:AcrR family transcriptional regulator
MITEDRRTRIVEPALSVFLRHGFRRVTMADIAREVGVSRPALYLEFQNKEDIFAAAVAHIIDRALDEIRRGLDDGDTLAAQLPFIFEIWTVRPYEMIRSSPDAEGVLETAHGVAREVMDAGNTAFEALLASLLAPYARPLRAHALTPESLARLLARGAKGLKSMARTTKELRAQLGDLIKLAQSATGGGTR